MKHSPWGFLTSIIVTIAIFSSCSERAPSIDPLLIDFGEIEIYSNISKRFTIHNPTSEAIETVSAKPSCTCTAVISSPTSIPARSSIDVEMTYTAPGTPKRIHEGIKIMLDDQEFTIELIGQTNQTIEISPNSIHALIGDDIKSFHRTFSIHPLSEPIADVVNQRVVISASNGNSIEAAEHISASLGTRLDENTWFGMIVFDAVRLQPYMPLSGGVEIELSMEGGAAKQVTVPFTAVQEPELSVSPSFISLKQGMERYPSITIQSKRPLQIESIRIEGMEEDIPFESRELTFTARPETETTLTPSWDEAIRQSQREFSQLRIRLKDRDDIAIPVTIRQN